MFEREEQVRKEFYIPYPSRIFVFSDTHFPFHDVNALLIALEQCELFKPTHIVLLGDKVDFLNFSTFPHNPTIRDISKGLLYLESFFKEIRRFFSGPIYYRIGNHEERFLKYLWKNKEMVEFFQLKNLGWEFILSLDEGVIVVEKQDLLFGNNSLFFWHGNELKNARGGEYFLKHYLEKYAVNGIVGHFHTSQSWQKFILSAHNGKAERKIIKAWSVGCLSELNPNYAVNNIKYCHGFATVEYDEEGYFQVSNYIIDGKRIYRS